MREARAMPADFLIRRALVADASSISASFRALIPYFTAQPDGAGAEGFHASISVDAIAGYIGSPRYDYWVAESAGRLAGFAAVRDRTHLYHLVVAAPYQRQGLGRLLWSTVRASALAAGNPGDFTVNASLYGVPVYQQFGFVPVGERTTANGVVFVPMRLRPEPG
jgi:GNAT superfamily N-acetyltransferase